MRFIKLYEVLELTALSKSTLIRLENEGLFPSRVKMAKRSVGWKEDDVHAWIRSRPSVVNTNKRNTIYLARLALGLSLEDLSSVTGIQTARLKLAEKGALQLESAELERLAVLLGQHVIDAAQGKSYE